MVGSLGSRPAATAALAALLLSGCGGSEPAAEPRAAETATATATPTATAAAPEGATVDMAGFAFVPARVTVDAGAKVTWIDRDKSNHTATFEDARQRGIANLRPGQKRSVTFRKRGTFPYVCEFHPGMAGTVEVR